MTANAISLNSATIEKYNCISLIVPISSLHDIYISIYCQKKKGRQVGERFNLPPFIDGSCRREPDFQQEHPTITALCHGGLFAPKLQLGDKVIFKTSQYTYPPYDRSHWRFVSVLTIVQRFESHEAAAEWFIDNRKSLPSNCMVTGNQPFPFEQTHLEIIPNLKQLGVSLDTPPEKIIKLWDSGYKVRAKKYPVFLVCSADYLELHNPRPIYKEALQTIFGKVPGTQNPKKITPAQLEQLLSVTTNNHS